MVRIAARRGAVWSPWRAIVPEQRGAVHTAAYIRRLPEPDLETWTDVVHDHPVEAARNRPALTRWLQAGGTKRGAHGRGLKGQ
jgi:hypothetical protein